MVIVCGAGIASSVSTQEPDSANNSNKNHFRTDLSTIA